MEIKNKQSFEWISNKISPRTKQFVTNDPIEHRMGRRITVKSKTLYDSQSTTFYNKNLRKSKYPCSGKNNISSNIKSRENINDANESKKKSHSKLYLYVGIKLFKTDSDYIIKQVSRKVPEMKSMEVVNKVCYNLFVLDK